MTFGNYQLEIYLQGLSGILPTLPMDYAGWEAKAEVAMPPSIWSYVAGGAGDEITEAVAAPILLRTWARCSSRSRRMARWS